MNNAQEKNRPAALERLLGRLAAGPGFTVSDWVIQTICGLVEKEADQAEVANAILHDPALTLSLLHLSNASRYLREARNVSTAGQILAILGLDALKSAALSLERPDASNCAPRQLKLLHAEVAVSLFSSCFAAGIARATGEFGNLHEAQVCGLLQNIGRIVALRHIFDDIEHCHNVMLEQNLVEDEAVQKALGLSFEDINVAVARLWELPDALKNSVAPDEASKSPPQPASNAMMWLRLCSLFSREIAGILFRLPENREKIEVVRCINFYQQALHLNEKDVSALIAKSLSETDASLALMGLSCTVNDARTLLRKGSERVWDMLLAQDNLVRKRGDGRAPIDAIKHLLRLIHNHCNFDCTLMCLPMGPTGLIAIAGVGRDAGRLATKFRISGLKQDIFREIAASRNDTFVADTGAPEYKERLPEWYREASAGRAFAMLPLLSGEHLIGMIYGDYSQPRAESPAELRDRSMLEWRIRLVNELEMGAREAKAPRTPSLILLHWGSKFIMDEQRPYVRIGRGVHSDIVMHDIRTSRKHAEIVRRQDHYVFIDRSFNGSYIFIEGEGETQVEHEEFVLYGSGSISLGYPHKTEGAETIEFFFQE
jgi:HD-like signal output (HDOD) protein